jgi:hypothetical protein
MSVRPAARHFEGRFTLVDPRSQLWIGTAVEENLDRQRVALGDGHMKRRVVVDPALIRVGAKRQQQPDDVLNVGPPGRAGNIAGAAQRRNQRRKPVVHRSLRVGTDFQ